MPRHFHVQDALARDMSVLVFCSTKKWCQQTANLLAKEVLSDRGRAAERASAAVARNSRVVRESESSGEGKMSLVGFVPATSVVPKAPASDTSAVATMKSTNPHSRVREGNEVLQDVGAKRAARTATITGKEQGTSVARPREVPLSPTPASVVREKLRETPVGLDADLSYLVRRCTWLCEACYLPSASTRHSALGNLDATIGCPRRIWSTLELAGNSEGRICVSEKYPVDRYGWNVLRISGGKKFHGNQYLLSFVGRCRLRWVRASHFITRGLWWKSAPS